MSVNYRVFERPDPRGLSFPKKFYAQLLSGDDVSFDELAELISKVSNLNYGTIMGTLGTFIEIIEYQLSHGRPVRLNNLGTLYLTLQSEGVEKAEDFTSDNIKGAKIRFRPGRRLKKLVKQLDYEKIATPVINISNDSDTDEQVAA